jgi:hypothetical protein
MRQPKHIPHNQVFVVNFLFPRSHVVYTTFLLLALQRVVSRGVEFVVVVFRYPHVVIGEQRTLRLYASLCGEDFLSWQWREFVADGVAAVGVLFRRINDFENAVIEGVGVEAR